MGSGTAWMVAGIILMLTGAGLFTITHILISRWIQRFTRLHD